MNLRGAEFVVEGFHAARKDEMFSLIVFFLVFQSCGKFGEFWKNKLQFWVPSGVFEA